MAHTNHKTKTATAGLRQFQQVLEEKSTELRAHIGNPAANPVLRATGEPYDAADWAEKSHEEWIFLQKTSFDTNLLREIEDALVRIREGSYGTCLDCGMPISHKRLDAVPWACYCVSCQERRQSGQN